MRIIFVRHGQSEANKKGIIQGQKFDTPLTKEGLQQAKRVAKRLSSQKINKIYSSPLLRAKQTAEEIAKLSDLEVNFDDRILEFNPGDFIGKNWNSEEVRKYFKKQIEMGISRLEVRPPNGENIWDFQKRIDSFLKEIEKKENNIIIVSHEDPIAMAINLLQGIKKGDPNFIKHKHLNTGISQMIWKDGFWKIDLLNSVSHLEEGELIKSFFKIQKRDG